MGLFKNSKKGTRKKIILLVLLMSIGVGILLHTIWSFRKFESGLGTQVAEVVIGYHIIILLGMVILGMGLGLGLDRIIRDRRFIFRSPNKGSWAEAIMNLWGYSLKADESTPAQNASLNIPEPPMLPMFTILNLPARRGRKPTFPLERWIPIALKWENRDPIRDAFTLGELIAEHLGTNPDGSPIVSEQTYYSVWRQRAIHEIRKRAEFRQPNAHQRRTEEKG